MQNPYLYLIALIWIFSNPLSAQDSICHHDQHHGYAPISIMGDHYHEKGGFMCIYKSGTLIF